MITSIGIVGNGVVGQATAAAWRLSHSVKVYDKYSHSPNTLEDVLECDCVMVCLPTPSESDDGLVSGDRLDIKAIDEFLHRYAAELKGKPILVRSTVPIGYCADSASLYELSLIHYPEFLTARTNVADALQPVRSVLGITRQAATVSADITSMVLKRFPFTKIMVVGSNESELIKLADNSFSAVKISFFNELFLLCQRTNISFDQVKAGMLAGGRISPDHTSVPGPDGKRGYGGACLPKDSNHLLWQSDQLGVKMTTILAAKLRNATVREE